MDRFVVREPRVGAEYPHNPQGNQPMSFRSNAPRNNNDMTLDNVYYGGYGAESPFFADGFGVQHRVSNAPTYSPINRHHPSQAQIFSGIDPRYLATYTDSNAAYIVTGLQMEEDRSRLPMSFGYENRTIVAPDRSKANTIIHEAPKDNMLVTNTMMQPNFSEKSSIFKSKTDMSNRQFKENSGQLYQQKQGNVTGVVSAPSPKISVDNPPKEENYVFPMTRAERLKVLHKSGPRAFSGPVEKVLKWHKALQEIGVLIIYEIVAKCVSVRPGDSCSKNLVVRDDNGPAMQVVYYEIDFLLPELKPPCTVRIVGRMMAGTCRLQAFNVRAATGDDVATLPRRTAVAAHHVAKMCKEYGTNVAH
ncbi:hypothetical protein evm_003672 [Chilo suppressalis]|nr:hypothetical protein evm_003672 [Chilo suppressalis]